MLLHKLNDGGLLNSLREADYIRQRLNNLFADGSADEFVASNFPLLNTWISEEGAVVTAELPGIEVADIEISIVNDTLTLKGERKTEHVSSDDTFHRRERLVGAFSRTVQLPFKIESDKVEAVFSRGILEITLPRAESEKPKRINVQLT